MRIRDEKNVNLLHIHPPYPVPIGVDDKSKIEKFTTRSLFPKVYYIYTRGLDEKEQERYEE